MTTNTVIVLVAFVVYMGLMILIGALNSKQSSNEDYFLGGRGLNSWTAALSAQASDMSGWLLMGLPGAIYFAGSGEMWIAIGLLIGTIANWMLVARRLRKYTIVANNSLTIPSFFENRFRDKKGLLKIVSSIVIIVFFAVYTASAFSAGAKLFANVFGTGADDKTAYMTGLIVAAVVILVYTLLGGFKAVCYTDFIQGMLMLIAIMAVPILAYFVTVQGQAGSISNAVAQHGVADPSGFFSLFKDSNGDPIKWQSVVSGLAWGLGYFGMPHILVRFMAIKSDKEVKKSRVIAIVWVIFSLGAACLLGLIARGYLTDTLTSDTKETVFIKAIQQLFDGNFVLVFVGGVFLCGILAAIMSTADSQLLVTASSVSEDMYKGVIRKNASEKKALLVGRIAVVVTAVVAFLIALDPKSSVMDLVSDAWAGFGAAFGPVILLCLFWKRFNISGAVSGMITGFLTVVVWDYIPFFGHSYTLTETGEALTKSGDLFVNAAGQTFDKALVTSTPLTLATQTAVYSLLIGFVLALAVAVIVTLLTKKPSAEVEADFEKVNSMNMEDVEAAAAAEAESKPVKKNNSKVKTKAKVKAK